MVGAGTPQASPDGTGQAGKGCGHKERGQVGWRGAIMVIPNKPMESKMQITKTSPVSGKENTLELNITQEQYNRWQAGEHIQNVMPHLSPDEREFLISGCTAEDWEKLFG